MSGILKLMTKVFRKSRPSEIFLSKLSHEWGNEWRKGDICSGGHKWKQCKSCGAEKTLDDEIFQTIEPAYCTPRA